MLSASLRLGVLLGELLHEGNECLNTLVGHSVVDGGAHTADRAVALEVTIPLAAFTKGRIKEASLDFVFIFGILGAVLGTYGAGQNYNAYPVLSMDNVISGLTHSISGFASLYIVISGMASMKKKNMIITLSILTGFCIAAYIANVLIPYNYMFLMAGDGTPYDIFYNLVNGSKVFYPIIVVGLFYLYISVFYLIYFFIGKRKAKKAN